MGNHIHSDLEWPIRSSYINGSLNLPYIFIIHIYIYILLVLARWLAGTLMSCMFLQMNNLGLPLSWRVMYDYVLGER